MHNNRDTNKNAQRNTIFIVYKCCKYLCKSAYWCLLLLTYIPLQAQSELTLAEVIQHVLANNLDIQTARNKQKIAAQNHHLGNAGFFPTLDTNLGLHKEHLIRSQKPNVEVANLSVGLGLQWNVFNGMRSIVTYQHLEQLSQISQLEIQQTIEEKVAETIIRCYTLVLAQQKKHVFNDSIAVAKEVLQLAEAQYALGQSTQLDYLTAQVAYNEEEANLLLQEEECTNARLALCSLLGPAAPKDFAIVEETPSPPKEDHWTARIESLAETNTGMKISQKRYEDARLAIKLEKAKLWPSIDLNIGYTLGRKYQDQRWEAKPQGLTYGISIRFNLFNAFRHATAIQEVGIQADNTQLVLRSQQIQLEAEWEKHFLHYNQQLKRYGLAQQHVQVSQNNVALALKQYRVGLTTLLELNKARQNAQETQLKCLQALYETKITEVALHKLSGTLLDAVL